MPKDKFKTITRVSVSVKYKANCIAMPWYVNTSWSVHRAVEPKQQTKCTNFYKCVPALGIEMDSTQERLCLSKNIARGKKLDNCLLSWCILFSSPCTMSMPGTGQKNF